MDSLREDEKKKDLVTCDVNYTIRVHALCWGLYICYFPLLYSLGNRNSERLRSVQKSGTET